MQMNNSDDVREARPESKLPLCLSVRELLGLFDVVSCFCCSRRFWSRETETKRWVEPTVSGRTEPSFHLLAAGKRRPLGHWVRWWRRRERKKKKPNKKNGYAGAGFALYSSEWPQKHQTHSQSSGLYWKEKSTVASAETAPAVKERRTSLQTPAFSEGENLSQQLLRSKTLHPLSAPKTWVQRLGWRGTFCILSHDHDHAEGKTMTSLLQAESRSPALLWLAQ